MVSDCMGVSVAVGDGGVSVALLSNAGVMVLVFTGFKPWQADNNKAPKSKNKSARFMMFANLTGGY
jgi:threonine/homoserine/homoserine lactone efflux protein